MIEELVSATVTTVATRIELDTELFEDEVRSLGRAVDSRRREFTTGRACARTALARLGLPATAVPSGTRGEPLWPAGVVGSITHCDRYRACALARAQDARSLGIDAEVDAPLPADILEAISSADERRALAAHGPGASWDRLLFSAKEAVFKAWFPLTGRGLGFDDVDVRIDPDRAAFRARLLVDRSVPGGADVPAELTGRWGVAGGIVATAVMVGRS
jgi:4'-phosphopantetheinyl transferase EntD